MQDSFQYRYSDSWQGYQQKFLCWEVPCSSGARGEGHEFMQDPFQYKYSDGWHEYQQKFLRLEVPWISDVKGEGQ